MTLDEYITSHIDPEPEYLYRLWRDTNVRLLRGRMASGHLQGRLLKMIVQMTGARNILEVGTFSGYSALCLAEGLGTEGHVYTFEINDEQEDFTRPWIEGSDYADRISFIIGDAITEAPRLAEREGITFDLAFVDGDKRTYMETYEMVLPLLRPGGLILADNTLWDGHVLDEKPRQSDRQTLSIDAFNDFVSTDPRVTRVLLPLRDGLTLIRKK